MRKSVVKLATKMVELSIRLANFVLEPIFSSPANTQLEDAIEPIRYSAPKNDLDTHLLVVMPFKDRWEMTDKLLDQVMGSLNDRVNLHVVLVDNNSREPETSDWIKRRETLENISFIRADFEFNFSKIINLGINFRKAHLSDHDAILILNNDLEFTEPNKLSEFILCHQEDRKSIYGCTLFYPDRTVQHLYAQPGAKIVATHPFKGQSLPRNHKWFDGLNEVPAVTGALMLFTYRCYLDAGGFDERLPTVGQDIDFCIAAESKGYQVKSDGKLQAIHFEGKTRGKGLNYCEVEYIYKKWGRTLTHYPLLLKGRTRWSEKIAVSVGEGAYPWRLFI